MALSESLGSAPGLKSRHLHGPRPPLTPATSRTRDALAPDHELDLKFAKFSDEYNLRLRIPAKGISPMSSRKLADDDERIYRRFKYHYHKRSLDSVCEKYRERAIDHQKKWVRKPKGERDVLPFSTGSEQGVLPAITGSERDELKRLLVTVFEDFKPKSLQQSIPEFKHGARSSRGHPGPPNQLSPKRHGEDVLTPEISPPKKTKSFALGRSTASRTCSSSQTGKVRPYHSFSGPSGNISLGTTVISDHESMYMASQTTQTTIEASSQEKFRHEVQLRYSRQESPTPGSMNPMMESRDQAEVNKDLQDDVRHLLDSGSPTYAYSDFSGLLDEDEIRACLDEDTYSGGHTPIEHEMSVADLKLDERLRASWPHIPSSLALAPFAIVWEVVRVLLHCQVDVTDFDVPYEDRWKAQNCLWKLLEEHPLLEDKTLPEKSPAAAWSAALEDFYAGEETVVLSMSLNFLAGSTGPFFQLQLQPLQTDKSYRLSRRFGPDRFIQMVIPTLEVQNIPSLRNRPESQMNHLRRWLLTGRHPLFGRVWAPFAVRSFRETAGKKTAKREDWYELAPRSVTKDQIYLFAENGNDFRTSLFGVLPPKKEPIDRHTRMTVEQLIGWLIQPLDNAQQPCLKLFSRISLGLSRTIPSVILQQDQIRIMEDDIRSPTNKVMNDGIGRMSPALALQIRNALHLDELPAGFQGRIGSAKGFWIRDIYDASDELWIELYPSQRKWECNFDDEDQRTFEVSSYPKTLEPASLNAQFLPIIEERVPQRAKKALKEHIGGLLMRTLRDEIESHLAALHDSVVLMAWVDKSSTSRRLERLREGEVPQVGGLPRSDEDRIQSLVAAGFNPLKQRFLWDLTWRLFKEKCEELKRRAHIKVGKSVYAFMVVDFWGILAEDEVHLGFSSNYSDPVSGWSETILHGMDVLVARSPSHFISDIQKVRAVFKPELASLKNVIIFPRKGNVALADKLSGGDYDGDMAWVCWDQDIVRDFVSAPVPETPDLFREGFLSKKTETYQDILDAHGKKAVSVFLEQGFDFNTQPKFLGMCTVFKEALCYHRKSVSDSVATRQSTLLSSLVDQAKQGIVFTARDFARFKKDLLRRRPEPGTPRYKNDEWTSKERPSHILDYLKFCVMIPAVEEGLAHLSASGEEVKPQYWDKDLALFFDKFNALRTTHNTRVAHGMRQLIEDLHYFYQQQLSVVSREDITFDVKVWRLYEDFRAISPTGFSSTVKELLTIKHEKSDQYTEWDLLKASTYFKLYHHVPFIWYIIGSQLLEIKARAAPKGRTQKVVSGVYAALKVDPKYARARASRTADWKDSFFTEDAD